jgi:predicted nucleic acid-binding protein
VIVVSDTGPLIALAKIGQLSVMARLFTEVLIPPGVHRELFAKSGPEEVLPLLQEVRQRGYWLSDALLDVAARLAGETGE